MKISRSGVVMMYVSVNADISSNETICWWLSDTRIWTTDKQSSSPNSNQWLYAGLLPSSSACEEL